MVIGIAILLFVLGLLSRSVRGWLGPVGMTVTGFVTVMTILGTMMG